MSFRESNDIISHPKLIEPYHSSSHMMIALVPYEYFKIKLKFLIKVFIIWVISHLSNSVLYAQIVNYQIPGSGKQVTIPFEYENNFIIVKLLFKKLIEVKFIIDSGAEYSVFTNKEVADYIGLNYLRTIKVLGADYTTYLDAYLSNKVDFDIGPLAIIEKNLLVLKDDFLGYDRLTEAKVVGIIGSDILSNFVVKIDYKHKKLTLIKPQFFKPDNNLLSIPMEIWKQKPYVKIACQINGNYTDSLKFLLDSGAGLAMLFLKNTHPSIVFPAKTINGRLGLGLGGYLEGILGRIKSLRFGGNEFQSVVCNFQDRKDYVDVLSQNGRNGIIGNGILSYFDIYLDYGNSKLYTKPNSKKIKEPLLDKSGLLIFATGQNLNKFIIRDITPGSPSDLAGILVGDKIKSINHWPSFLLTTNRITKMLSKKVGKEISITLDRQGVVVKKRFILRELI